MQLARCNYIMQKARATNMRREACTCCTLARSPDRARAVCGSFVWVHRGNRVLVAPNGSPILLISAAISLSKVLSNRADNKTAVTKRAQGETCLPRAINLPPVREVMGT